MTKRSVYWNVAAGLLVAVAMPVLARAEPPRVRTQTLFQKPASQGEYRIPGIIALPGGTVLVFCADRKGRGDFGHETTTVVRRSTDGGKTWGPLREIAARSNTDIHSGPVVYDREKKRLIKFCRYWPAKRDAREITNSKTYDEMAQAGWIDHWQSSDDEGETWSKPAAIRLDYPRRAYSAATGNGVHGIQLASGRLLVQAGYASRREGELHRHCCVFASDDHGATWQRVRDFDTAEIKIIREFVMAEKSQGGVYYNFRSTQGWRAVVDKGPLQDDDELGDVQCHAGLATWRRTGNPWWVFSYPNPTGPARRNNFTERRQRLVLRVSRDEGVTWPKEIVVHAQAAAYSDVAVLPNGTALVVFENGDKVGQPYQRISLARVSLDR